MESHCHIYQSHKQTIIYMDYGRLQLLQTASLECKVKISAILLDTRVSNFKIGKTVDAA